MIAGLFAGAWVAVAAAALLLLMDPSLPRFAVFAFTVAAACGLVLRARTFRDRP